MRTLSESVAGSKGAPALSLVSQRLADQERTEEQLRAGDRRVRELLYRIRNVLFPGAAARQEANR